MFGDRVFGFVGLTTSLLADFEARGVVFGGLCCLCFVGLVWFTYWRVFEFDGVWWLLVCVGVVWVLL